MFPLYSILTEQTQPATGLNFGPVIAAICAVVLLIAFSAGFKKGFRRVRWGGLIWFTVSLAFVGVYKFTPVGALIESMALVGAIGYAIGCVLAVLAVYGLLAQLIRPRMKWVKDDVNGDDSLAEYGLEFEPEYVDYDGENDYAPYGKILQKTGYAPPSFFGRLLGGLTGAVNSLMALFGMLGFVFVVLSSTGLSAQYLDPLTSMPLMQSLLNIVASYALDVLALGLILAMAIKGYDKGFFSSLRALLVTGGGIAAVVLCFVLPFTAYATATEGIFSVVGALVDRTYNTFVNMGALATIIARLLTGAILAVFAIIFFVLINVFLKKCCNWIEKVGPTRVVDGCLAAALYAGLGLVAAIAISFAMGALDVLNIVKFSEILGEGAILSKTLLDFAKTTVSGLLAPFMG